MSQQNETQHKSTAHSAKMLENAEQTTDFLKSIAHAGRLMILCRLAEGPASVGELEKLLSIRQASVSKQLTRLKEEGLVDCKRNGRSIIYSLSDERARKLVNTLYELFCNPSDEDCSSSCV